MPRRDSRALILSAARKEFAAKGFDGARIEAIADAAGVNKQLIFYYFKSKRGLHAHVTSDVAGEVARIAPPTDDRSAPGQLRAAVAGLHDLIGQKPEILGLLLDRNRAGAAARAGRTTVSELASHLREAISAGQGLGYFRDDADPDRAALQALCLIVGFGAIRDLLPPGHATEEAWKASAGDLLTKGLAW